MSNTGTINELLKITEDLKSLMEKTDKKELCERYVLSLKDLLKKEKLTVSDFFKFI